MANELHDELNHSNYSTVLSRYRMVLANELKRENSQFISKILNNVVIDDNDIKKLYKSMYEKKQKKKEK